MEQPVYMDLDTYNGIRMMHQNEEQLQHNQYQQGIIMSNDQQQEVIIQDDSQQHIVYSHLKQNEPQQYISQVEHMQGQQYLIHTPGQQPQVVFANISPQNQIKNQQQQQTIQLNHNLIAQQNQNQQKQFVIQQSPTQKVVVQRNPDILQSATSMAQIVDHPNQQIQYLTTQMDQNQTQQYIIQQPSQQIKQTMYPQQQNQVMAQPQYMQLQQIQQQNVQQGSPKVLMQGNQVRFIAKPQQLLPTQGGQIVQLSQQPQQLHTQNQVRQQFRPRMMSAPLKVHLSNPQLPQQQQMTARNRAPRPRVVRPQAQNALMQQQALQNNQPRLAQQVKQTSVVFMVQTQPDGTSVLVPQLNQHNQQAQTVRVVQQKVVQIQQPQQQQQYQATSNQISEIQQQRTQVAEIQAPTTSTFTPKKDGECDDLEDSITATAISKSTRSEPPPLQPQSGITMEEYRKRTMQQSNRIGVVRPMMNNSVNHSPIRNQAQQVIRQRPVPRLPQFQQPGLNQQLEVAERESAKMLVILDNGEQRLITFTLPKETCTVQELLDQVGIQVGADSNIECIENPNSEIDYIVKVGNFASRDTAAMTKAAENHIRQQQNRQLLNQRNTSVQQQQVVQTPEEVAKSKSPEIKPPPQKLVPGFFAVCGDCGFSGIDHAKCVRCLRVFKDEPKMQRMPPSQVKSSPIPVVASSTQTHKLVQIGRVNNSADKKDQIEAIQKKHQMTTAQKNNVAARGRGGMTPRGRGQRSRAKPVEPVVVDLISDDENDGSDESKSSVAKALAMKRAELLLQKKSFEPDIVDDIPADDFVRLNIEEFVEGDQKISTSFSCRTIRIGTHKFDSKEKVVITPKGIKIVAPSLKNPSELIVLHIQSSEIVKLVAHFSKQLHIIFLYTKPSCARYINEQLQMVPSDKSPFYSPISRNEPQKKIVFLAESVSDDTKNVIRSIYSRQILEEISNRDANEMLVRSTGIPILSSPNSSAVNQNANNTADGALLDEDVKQLFIYPPTGKGGLAITTNDYVCLGAELYLNDVIIDFYLKYLHQEILTPDQRDKTHIFSQFFYKRLTQMNRDKESKLTAPQKRHVRVANWTKNVNIFEKDFVIIPINEQSHWFLAIICFPNMTEPHTMDTNQPIKLIPVQKRPKKKAPSLQIGNTTITPLNKKEESICVGDDGGSERDEAEGEESDLGSNMESDEEEEVIDRGQPVKVPSILLFDSLLGAPRTRVVATLRDYLTCEYKAKYPNEPLRIYNKTVIAGHQVKVPQQNNFFDCGVFLLHYVEQFFKDPIKDYRIPIKHLLNWFHHDDVTRKREEIAKIIEDQTSKNHPEGIELPEIIFPTKDGKILETETEETAAAEAFDESEYVPTEEDFNMNGSKSQPTVGKPRVVFNNKKRSLEKTDSSSGESSSKTPKISAKNKS